MRRLVFIVISLLVLWYTVHAVLSRFVGTCTMGDTDRFVAGIILGIPAAVIAVALLQVGQANTSRRRGIVLATLPVALVVLYLWVPLAISTGIQGHHLCGSEFDEYLDTRSKWERLIPFAHVAAAIALLLSAGRKLHRGISHSA